MLENGRRCISYKIGIVTITKYPTITSFIDFKKIVFRTLVARGLSEQGSSL